MISKAFDLIGLLVPALITSNKMLLLDFIGRTARNGMIHPYHGIDANFHDYLVNEEILWLII